MFAKIHTAIYTGFSFNIAIYAGVIKPENQSIPYSSGMYKQTTIYATFSLYIDMIKWDKKYTPTPQECAINMEVHCHTLI